MLNKTLLEPVRSKTTPSAFTTVGTRTRMAVGALFLAIPRSRASPTEVATVGTTAGNAVVALQPPTSPTFRVRRDLRNVVVSPEGGESGSNPCHLVCVPRSESLRKVMKSVARRAASISGERVARDRRQPHLQMEKYPCPRSASSALL